MIWHFHLRDDMFQRFQPFPNLKYSWIPRASLLNIVNICFGTKISTLAPLPPNLKYPQTPPSIVPVFHRCSLSRGRTGCASFNLGRSCTCYYTLCAACCTLSHFHTLHFTLTASSHLMLHCKASPSCTAQCTMCTFALYAGCTIMHLKCTLTTALLSKLHYINTSW